MRIAPFAISLLLATPAAAEWRIVDGAAVVDPVETNANIESLMIFCGAPVNVELYTTGGPVRPRGYSGEADYFYEADRVIAVIDGAVVPLIALGAGHALILEAQDTDGEIGNLGLDFVDALRRGESLTLAFDVTAEDDAETGSAFETYARFSLAGSAIALGEAFSACP